MTLADFLTVWKGSQSVSRKAFHNWHISGSCEAHLCSNATHLAGLCWEREAKESVGITAKKSNLVKQFLVWRNPKLGLRSSSESRD